MTANLIIHNAKIYTVDPARPWAEAVAVRDGRILAVGGNDDILALAGPKTERIHAHGRLVLPGLTDAHVHFLQFAIRRHQFSLFGERDFSQVQRLVQTAVAAAKPGHWVQGWGWDENLWDVLPTASHLDEIAPDTPIALARMDMHTWWVNSAALQIAGITAETPDPPESKIERDADGRPTGILREWNAIELVRRHIPEPNEVVLAQWLADAIGEAHRLGLTGIHDQRVENEGAQSFRLWQQLERDGRLQLRVHMNIAAEFLSAAAALGLQPGFGSNRLWVGHVKAFADGTMGSHTAWMLEPFTSDPGNTGVAVTATDELWQLATQAADAGYSLSVHAIGDRAVREVLDVYQEQATRHPLPATLPPRIEHVQLIHPDDIGRLADLGVVASMQPVHLLTDWPTADKVWGERARYTYAFRTLLDNGTPLALGSDSPVAPLNPMLSFYAALTRQGEDGRPANGWYPQEKITLPEVIAGFTIAPAQLSGRHAVQGSITPGKWADLVVMGQNLFEMEPSQMHQAEVDMTIFSGELVYSQEN